jgi:tetratricopeptide (TPR) repeat protein
MATFDHPVVSPVVVGRDDALAVLDSVLERAASGDGQTLLITGEAGVGKSRLIRELRDRAARLGIDRLEGHSFEQDQSIPYAPVVDLLRTDLATRSPADIAGRLGPGVDLTAILPELQGVIPSVDAVDSPVDPEQRNRRLTHSLIGYFTQRAAGSPIAIVFEDVHWSDEASLDLIGMLARTLAGRPALLVLTYRSNEIGPGLGRMLAGLDRDRRAAELRLSPLTIGDVDAMIRAIFSLGRPTPTEALTAIYGLAEGNPFFVEEILRSIAASGLAPAGGIWRDWPADDLRIPRSVEEAVRERTSRLAPETRRTLDLAAVAGRRFDFGLLQALEQRDERSLLRSMKELIEAQLVVEESADRFAFRHALIRQAIYGELLLRERRALHRTIAESLERLHRGPGLDARLADLSYHYYAAGVWDQALVSAFRAGERDRALYAPRAAIEQYSRAIEAASRGGFPVPAALLQARGQAFETVGDFDRARADLEAALAAAPDEALEWEITLALGMLWAGRDYSRGGEYYRRALDLARTIGTPDVLARSLNRWGNWLVNIGETAEGLAAHREALAIFEAEGNAPGAAETLDLLGMGYGIHGDVVESVRRFGQAIELFRATGDRLSLASSLGSRALYTSPSFVEGVSSAFGTAEASGRDADESVQLGRQIESQAAQAFALWGGGAAQSAFGNFGAGLAMSREALRIATNIGHEQWIAGARFALGTTYLYLLAPAPAIEELEAGLAIARQLGSAWWIGGISASLAMARLLARDPAGAQATLDAVFARGTVPRNLPERRMAWAWGEVALQQGSPVAALEIAEQLIVSAASDPHTGGFAGSPSPLHVGTVTGGDLSPAPSEAVIPAVLALHGNALLALGRFDEALVSRERAADGARRSGARPLLWQVYRSIGWAHQQARRPDLADRVCAQARSVVQDLAATIDEVDLREGFLRAAFSTMPAERPVSPRRAEAERFGGLSAREREVAGLLARGYSNAAIAEALVVSERTAEAHVGNILNKLGLSSRAQAAVWAVEHGLGE